MDTDKEETTDEHSAISLRPAATRRITFGTSDEWTVLSVDRDEDGKM